MGHPVLTLVTRPMLQRRPNPKELRSMDSYIQILCRFQKCKRKVPPLSLPCSKNLKRLFFQNLPRGTKGKNLKKEFEKKKV
jgi:hypothetical protein